MTHLTSTIRLHRSAKLVFAARDKRLAPYELYCVLTRHTSLTFALHSPTELDVKRNHKTLNYPESHEIRSSSFPFIFYHLRMAICLHSLRVQAFTRGLPERRGQSHAKSYDLSNATWFCLTIIDSSLCRKQIVWILIWKVTLVDRGCSGSSQSMM